MQKTSVLLTCTLLTKTSSHDARVPSRVLVTLTDQWEGAGTPSMFCILEGSANMVAASAAPGRQFISEPPTQLWGAAARKQRYSAVRYYCGDRIKGHPAFIAYAQDHRGLTYPCCWTPQGRRRAWTRGLLTICDTLSKCPCSPASSHQIDTACEQFQEERWSCCFWSSA